MKLLSATVAAILLVAAPAIAQTQNSTNESANPKPAPSSGGSASETPGKAAPTQNSTNESAKQPTGPSGGAATDMGSKKGPTQNQ